MYHNNISTNNNSNNNNTNNNNDNNNDDDVIERLKLVPTQIFFKKESAVTLNCNCVVYKSIHFGNVNVQENPFH